MYVYIMHIACNVTELYGEMCNISKQRYVYLITIKGVEKCNELGHIVLPKLCFILNTRIFFGIHLHVL